MLHDFLNFLFPKGCAFCDAQLEEGCQQSLCATCQSSTQWLTGPVKVAAIARPAWNNLYALCRYDGPVQSALHRLKYQHRPELARALGQHLSQQLESNQYTAIVPVPMGAWRTFRRGYNQAQLIAQPCAQQLGARLRPCILKRRRGARPQVGLSQQERLTNMQPSCLRVNTRTLKANERILLIDDIATTGATLHACAQALRKAGVKHIDAAVVALA